MEPDRKTSTEDFEESVKDEVKIVSFKWGRTIVYLLLVVIIGLLLWKPGLFQ